MQVNIEELSAIYSDSRKVIILQKWKRRDFNIAE